MEEPNFEVSYSGDLRTQMEHLRSGTVILTDAPVDNNGKGEMFSPTDLLASALSACMLTVIGIHLNKKGKGLKEVRTEVQKVMTSGPRRISEIYIEFDWGENDFSPKEMKEIREIAMNCPVAKSLSDEIAIRTNFPV